MPHGSNYGFANACNFRAQKVDAKTKTLLDEYNKKRRKTATGKSPTTDETDHDFMDDDIRHADKMTKEQVRSGT